MALLSPHFFVPFLGISCCTAWYWHFGRADVHSALPQGDKMVLTEFYLNGIRIKKKPTILTEEQKRRLFEFDLSAGYRGDFKTWKESLNHTVDKKAEKRYRQAVAAGSTLSFEDYKEKVMKK
jgi:hypothetical protein